MTTSQTLIRDEGPLDFNDSILPQWRTRAFRLPGGGVGPEVNSIMANILAEQARQAAGQPSEIDVPSIIAPAA